jgi:hypothetical protein
MVSKWATAIMFVITVLLIYRCIYGKQSDSNKFIHKKQYIPTSTKNKISNEILISPSYKWNEYIGTSKGYDSTYYN